MPLLSAPSHSQAELAQSAPLGLELSRQHCSDACREYHGIWGFLRLYGVLVSVGRDAGFYHAACAEAARAGARRVLISGAADQGILACAVQGFENAGVQGRYCVVDQCRTPLGVNEWYGHQRGLDLRVVQGDILLCDEGPQDLILAHNFLNFFDAGDRARLARVWARLLAPGGQVLLINRIKPDAPVRARRFGSATADKLRARLLAARQDHPHADLIGEEQLAALVEGYAQKRIGFNMRSEAELRGILTGAGLEVVSWAPVGDDPSGGRYGDHGGPRLGVIARKPG